MAVQERPIRQRAAARATDLAGRLDPTAKPFSARTGKKLSSGRLLLWPCCSARAGGQTVFDSGMLRDLKLEPGAPKKPAVGCGGPPALAARGGYNFPIIHDAGAVRSAMIAAEGRSVVIIGYKPELCQFQHSLRRRRQGREAAKMLRRHAVQSSQSHRRLEGRAGR
jgi:hypothetical protein